VEINTSEAVDTESDMSGELQNPNDEISVTYLFYELQRRFRVSEQIHRLTPVVLVAQEVPEPHEIDEDWLVAHDWILKRVCLDDSFIPALEYLSTRVIGDEVAREELRKNVAEHRRILEEIKGEVVTVSYKANQRYAALEAAIDRRAIEAGQEGGGGLLGTVSSSLFGGGGDADEVARIREDAAKDASERAARIEKEQRDRLEREVTALNAASESYTKALSEHLNRKAQIARLRLHVRQNILYYMQATWSYEPPDQRYFRLHQVPVPVLRTVNNMYWVKPALSVVTARPGTLTAANAVAVLAGKTLEIDPNTVPLRQVADLNSPLGFKGNYIMFPLLENNALTDFMKTPYADNVTELQDPDPSGNWTLAAFAHYLCCLKERATPAEFDGLRDTLQGDYDRLLQSQRKDSEEILVPTGSLFIETLPGTQPILENFKLMHRAVDVKKVQAEVRKAELENLRYASRIAQREYGDPEVEKVVVVEGQGSGLVVTP
jgi:hypothetical protein